MWQPTNFFKLIRWKNILIYILLTCLIYYKFLWSNDVSFFEYAILSSIIVLFGAAGNIQNNILDFKLDQQKNQFINFDKKRYASVYYLLLSIGVLLTIFLSLYVESYVIFLSLASFPILLNLYNFSLKKYALIGNLIVAFLTSFAIFVGLFHFSNTYFWDTHKALFNFYFVMAFILNLMRELVKDMEDMPIDKQFNYHTLPIISLKISKLVYVFYVILFILAFYYFRIIFDKILLVYLFIATIFPVIFSLRFLQKHSYSKLTKLLKLVMILGILSLFLQR